MILPKMSAALLSMSFFGSAYACADLHGHTSLDQWVVICGAANGAAAVFQALPHDLAQHRETAKTHISRFAAESGMSALEFEPLFERGLTEGQRLVASRSTLFTPRKVALLDGFHHDKHIAYADVRRAFSS
ncbi:hypothetical protein [Pusillimonas noertemannii]|uniref:Uncharacterized protein n=1 Tax=Pusillimonas noertemannii TaxID=305977 RepID=A0A2U1CR35_9BURK|nr:hypothetical protein [Pusillimonas noertemannii]NYT67674.1 hypothetical protein [Pusillimonas noertemannii]PVY68346.1 hypothetical protein C7440_0741 [Pusillimonas noertemannii]TFL12167.1 hypothetical protein CSC72_03350 [Pusillimonas noertemannii]